MHPSQYDESEYNWLLNLDVDHDTAIYKPTTPISVKSPVPSTPALPTEVIGSEYTETPARYSPNPEDDLEDEIGDEDHTVSDKTYDNIRESISVPFPL